MAPQSQDDRVGFLAYTGVLGHSVLAAVPGVDASTVLDR